MLPGIKKGSGITKTVQVRFGGLDLRPEAGDGTFGWMNGISPEGLPLLASRRRRMRYIGDGSDVNAVYAAGDALITVEHRNCVYYNGWMLAQSSWNGPEELRLVRFGNKAILEQPRELLDLSRPLLGIVAAQEALPQSGNSEGDAWAVGNPNNGQNPDIYVWTNGVWVDAGPVLKTLEAEASLSNVYIGKGSYQGQAAAMHTIRAEGANPFQDIAVGDAVTISGCTGQPGNNQTLVVREIVNTREMGEDVPALWELRFYEHAFRFPLYGTHRWGITGGGENYSDVLFQPGNIIQCFGELPEAAKGAFFPIPLQVDGTPFVVDNNLMLVVRDLREWEGNWEEQWEPIQCDFYRWNESTNVYDYLFTRERVEESGTSLTVVAVPFERSTEAFPGMDNNQWNEFQDRAYYMEAAVTISRRWPELEGMFCAENRLWGWAGNSVYASKLGDPGNWFFYDGTAEDSWSVEVQSPGPFTGGIGIHGNATFWKENKRYTVYGSQPAAYQLAEQDCHGVREGCGASLAVLDGVLYYVSRVGVMADSGSIPALVSEALGPLRLTQAVAGTEGTRYWLSAVDEDGNGHLLALETRLGIWIRDGEDEFISFATVQGRLYGVRQPPNTWAKDLVLWGTEPPWEGFEDTGTIYWDLITNDYIAQSPNRKRVHRVQLRFRLGAEAALQVLIQYDNETSWRPVKTIAGAGEKRSYYLPVLPRRCDTFRLKLTGFGEFELQSLSLDLRQGSEMF